MIKHTERTILLKYLKI